MLKQATNLMHDVPAKLKHIVSSIFDEVWKNSSAPGSPLSAFDHLTKSAAPVEIRAPSMDHLHAMNEQLARQARGVLKGWSWCRRTRK